MVVVLCGGKRNGGGFGREREDGLPWERPRVTLETRRE